jgi:DNA helicase-2/ATP-dependent DNA helicase PcrA
MTAPPTSTRPGTIPAEQFFELIDEVLAEVGREPLDGGDPHRHIITVTAADRVLQILAGAGSGKTEMLVWRVLYELMVLGTQASRVIVTTFTRKAATELAVRMVERSDALLEQARKRGLDPADPHVHDLRIGTLHSLCDALLAEFDAEYMAAGTEVIDETETRIRLSRVHRWALGYNGRTPGRVVDRLLAREELVALFRPPWDDGYWPGNNLQRMGFLQAVLAQHTETWLPRCGPTSTPNGIEALCPGITADLIKLQERWEEHLDSQQILDFATIQHRFHQRQDAVLDHIDHVFVDEFQDTNPIQLAIHLHWLTRPETRLTVVGDDDQALYRFRGSDIACFTGLEAECQAAGVSYRREKLEQNWRSTKRIVAFASAFRDATVLSTVSMPKKIRAPKSAPLGEPPRLLQGPWTAVCDQVATEIDALGAGRVPDGPNQTPAPSVAVLLFSTSEKEGQRAGTKAALDLRRALERRGLRVYNPRNKTAARQGSPVYSLAGLLSYLVDPVICAPAGKGGRDVMVWASCNEAAKASYSPIAPPSFAISTAHANIQKGYRGSTAGIRNPDPTIVPLLSYLDTVRTDLVAATDASRAGRGQASRLTLAGVVARLLAFPQFRNVGFTPTLFREALFTQLLEANIAPTRRTRTPLDHALAPYTNGAGKIVWPDEMWSFLGLFGALISETDLDDIEDDSFAEHAVALLTYHQAKGLEFDHVYVGVTGREPAVHSVLQTMLFSGDRVRYKIGADGQPKTSDPRVGELALADRERELYVALTRAKERLTIIYDPNDKRPMCSLNPALKGLFDGQPAKALAAGVTEKRWKP